MQKKSKKNRKSLPVWPLLLGLMLISSLTVQASTNDLHVDGDLTVTGDTGIGTTTPDAKLEVVGDILADGYVYSETTDRKVFGFNNGVGWYRIIDSWAYGPGVWVQGGKLRLLGFSNNNKPMDTIVHLSGGGPFGGADQNGITITRASNYNGSEFTDIRVGYRTGNNFVVDLYKQTSGSSTGIIEVTGSDALRLVSSPSYNPSAPDLSSMEKDLRVLGIAHQINDQSFGTEGADVGIGTESPTAKLHVDGDAKFEDAVYLLDPQGDISMGSYTNGLP